MADFCSIWSATVPGEHQRLRGRRGGGGEIAKEKIDAGGGEWVWMG